MKIFNWVHRRFNNHREDELAKDAKISDHEISIDIDETKFVVKNYSNFNGWKGGILTIGTFGYDPLKNEEIHHYDDDDDEEHAHVDYSNSVIEQGMSSDQIDQVNIDSGHDEKDDEVKPLMMHAAAAYAHEDFILKMEQVIIDEKKKEEVEVEVDFPKKERTTLAELFVAEQSEEGNNKSKPIVMIDAEKMMKKKEYYSCEKNRISSADSNKKSDKQETTARPMGKRLHRLVKRVLKKKIHPELVINSNKHIDPAAKDTHEFDSLLPIQDAVI